MRNLFSFLIATVCILFLPAAACGEAARDVAKTGASVLIDCTAGELGKTAGELAPMAEKIVLDAIDSTGKVNWDPVKEYGKGLATDVGKCVLAEGIARALAPKPADPNAPKSADVVVDADAVKAGFANTVRQLYGDVTFQTSAGVL